MRARDGGTIMRFPSFLITISQRRNGFHDYVAPSPAEAALHDVVRLYPMTATLERAM